MRITGIRVENFKSLRDFEMKDVPGFAVPVGANGTGKSIFIDVFDFINDCLQDQFVVCRFFLRTAIADEPHAILDSTRGTPAPDAGSRRCEYERRETHRPVSCA